MNQKIIEPLAVGLIEAELTPERFLRTTNKGGNELYVVTATILRTPCGKSGACAR